jgi:hypothetical protein
VQRDHLVRHARSARHGGDTRARHIRLWGNAPALPCLCRDRYAGSDRTRSSPPIRGAVARGRLRDHRQQPLGRGKLPPLSARKRVATSAASASRRRSSGRTTRSYCTSRFLRTASSASTTRTYPFTFRLLDSASPARSGASPSPGRPAPTATPSTGSGTGSPCTAMPGSGGTPPPRSPAGSPPPAGTAARSPPVSRRPVPAQLRMLRLRQHVKPQPQVLLVREPVHLRGVAGGGAHLACRGSAILQARHATVSHPAPCRFRPTARCR